MTSLHAARRSDPFRQHNPNVPHYNPRLSEEQWETLKPRIAEMHGAGWTCVDILRELKSINVVVTRSQLDFRIKKWGLVKPKTHQGHHELRELDDIAAFDPRSSQRQPTNDDIHTLPFEAMLPPSREVEVLSSNPNPNHSALLFDPSEHSGTPPSILEETRQLGVRDISQLQTMESTHHAKSRSPNAPTSSLDILLPNLQDMDPLSTSSSRPDQDAISIREGTFFPAILQEANVSYPPLRLPPYELSSTVQHLWQSRLSSAAQNPSRPKIFHSSGITWAFESPLRQAFEMLPSIVDTALFLSDMKCFGEAFEVWYLITSRLNDVILSDQLLGPQLIFAATACARSARTTEHLLVADALAEQLCDWRSRWFLHQQDQPIDFELRTELPSLLALAENLLGEGDKRTMYWAATHYPADAIGTGPYIIKEIRFGARYKEKAFWTKDLRDWPKDILTLFFVSYDIQHLMVKALGHIETHIRCEPWKIDEILGKYWPPAQDTSTSFAQALACLVLEHYNSWSSETRRRTVPTKRDKVYTQFMGQALAILPFVVVRWIQKPEVFREIINESKQNRDPCSHGLGLAMDHVRHVLDSYSILDYMENQDEEYQLFVEVYLEQLMNHETWEPSMRIFHGDRFVHAAAALAGIAMHPRREWSDRAPDKPLEVSSESKHGTDLVIGQSTPAERLSISSSIVDPPMALSCRSSMSSGFRSLKAMSSAIRFNGSITNLSIRTSSTGRSSDNMSWRFSAITGFPSSSSVCKSTSVDTIVDGMEEDALETAGVL